MKLRKALVLTSLAGLVVLTANCGDSGTEPTVTENASFELTGIDNASLPVQLFTIFVGTVHMESATLKPAEPGKMRDVRVLKQAYSGGSTLTRDSTIVEVKIEGSRFIVHRPHPNPALAYTDTGSLTNGTLILPTTLDYRAQLGGVPLKNVQLIYRVIP
jgi:hypothetical protein